MENEGRQILSKQIKQLRQERGWSQDDLAATCGLHRTYIGTVERCEQSITIDSIEKIAKAFGVRIKQLFEE